MLEPWAKMTIAVAGTATIAVSQMFLLHRPAEGQIREVLASQEGVGFSYPEVGATRTQAPAGYQVHREYFALGHGQGAFERAKQALRQWRMFDLGWLELCWPDAPVVSGSTVAVLARHLGLWSLHVGFWSLHVARIVYVIDEPRKYGFAYGTLAEHAESGEEWFGVEQREDHSVWYEEMAFSREKHLLAKIGYPFTRSLQRKFRRDSGLAMQRAAASGG
jgi:uncharacterized protein (UPF0548 family)